MEADDSLADDPTPLPRTLHEYVPRAMEIMTLFHQGEHELANTIIDEYPLDDLQGLLATMGTLAAGLLEVAYSCTEVPEDQWMSHFSTGVTGWLFNE